MAAEAEAAREAKAKVKCQQSVTIYVINLLTSTF